MAKFYVITLARVSSNGDCSIVRFGGRLGSRLRGTAVEQLGANLAVSVSPGTLGDRRGSPARTRQGQKRQRCGPVTTSESKPLAA
jgi:hypothetical protein